MNRIFLAITLLLIALIFACSKKTTNSDDSQITPGQVAGDYKSTTFKVQPGDTIIDVLAVGGFINLTLKTDQTTKGRIFIPDTLGLTEGGNFDEDLTGTYSISGNTLTFQQTTDTFIREAKWIYEDSRLRTNDFATVILQKK